MKNGISGEKKIGFFIKFKKEVSNQIFVLENIQLFNYRLDDGYTKVYDVDETNFDTRQNTLFYKESNRYISDSTIRRYRSRFMQYSCCQYSM